MVLASQICGSTALSSAVLIIDDLHRQEPGIILFGDIVTSILPIFEPDEYLIGVYVIPTRDMRHLTTNNPRLAADHLLLVVASFPALARVIKTCPLNVHLA